MAAAHACNNTKHLPESAMAARLKRFRAMSSFASTLSSFPPTLGRGVSRPRIVTREVDALAAADGNAEVHDRALVPHALDCSSV